MDLDLDLPEGATPTFEYKGIPVRLADDDGVWEVFADGQWDLVDDYVTRHTAVVDAITNTVQWSDQPVQFAAEYVAVGPNLQGNPHELGTGCLIYPPLAVFEEKYEQLLLADPTSSAVYRHVFEETTAAGVLWWLDGVVVGRVGRPDDF